MRVVGAMPAFISVLLLSHTAFCSRHPAAVQVAALDRSENVVGAAPLTDATSESVSDDRSLFGFAGHNPGIETSRRFYDIGIRWLRADMGWHHLEPEPGEFDFDGMDRVIEANLAAGLNVLGLIGYSPGWASKSDEGNRGSEVDEHAWRRFVATTVNRYRDRIRYWEIWNEPNIPPFWRPMGDPAGYARLLRAAYEEIKRIDPALHVVFGGTARPDVTFIAEVCAQIRGRRFDILAYHPYSFQPEAQMRQDAERMRQALAQYGRRDTPVWLTEDASGADFLLRNHVMAIAADVDKLFTYDDTFHAGNAPDIDKAYHTASTQLGRACYIGALETLEGVEIHVLADDTGPFLVAWSVVGETSRAVAALGDSLRMIAWDGTRSALAVRGGRARCPLTKAASVFRGEFPQEVVLRAALSLQTLPVKPLQPDAYDRALRGTIRLPQDVSVESVSLRAVLPTGWTATPEYVSLSPTAHSATPVEFIIHAPPDARTGVYPLLVRALWRTAAGPVSAVARASAWIEPTVKWTYFIGQEIQSSPALAQLDSDPEPEILLGANDRMLHAIDGSGARLWALDVGARQTATLACADLDQDGKDETVVPQNDHEISLVDDDGSVIWTRELGSGVQWGGAVIADLDGDGRHEALTGTAGGEVYCFDGASGEPKWRYDCGGPIEAPIAVGDADQAAGLETVAPAGEAGLVCLRGDGTPAWVFRDGSNFYCGPLILDVDSDGEAEVVCGSGDDIRGVHCISGRTGEREWLARTPESVDAALAAADVDGDGMTDVVFADVGGWTFALSGERGAQDTIFSLDGTGQEKWRYRCGGGVDSAPCIADVTGDGRLDVLLGSGDRSLYCLDRQGKLQWQFRTDMKISVSPAVADVDGDGILEILVASRDGKVYCLSTAGRGPVAWPTKRGSPASSGAIARPPR
ncbi:MAG: PQQ-binding-like beta-propeller repeat protein [Armatimonadota bacterium]|nr:MAG: PQQ-binding-like beta-propeller repeat protein [Armatimonadota bacterium]